jgi:hypothetical protein
MKRTAKVLATAVAVAVTLWVVIVNFSASETRLQCSGALTVDGNPASVVAFMKLHRYRWWVGLWSKSDAVVWVEIPTKAYEYYGDVQLSGDNLLISDQPRLGGIFSTLSSGLSLNIAGGVFDGLCKPLN